MLILHAVLMACTQQSNALRSRWAMQAAYHGVPIVGLPLWGEQPDNVARAVEQGFGLRVSIDDTQSLARNLYSALQRVLSNPSFATNAARVSNLIRATRESPASQAASKSVSLVDMTPLQIFATSACLACRCQCMPGLSVFRMLSIMHAAKAKLGHVQY